MSVCFSFVLSLSIHSVVNHTFWYASYEAYTLVLKFLNFLMYINSLWKNTWSVTFSFPVRCMYLVTFWINRLNLDIVMIHWCHLFWVFQWSWKAESWFDIFIWESLNILCKPSDISESFLSNFEIWHGHSLYAVSIQSLMTSSMMVSLELCFKCLH